MTQKICTATIIWMLINLNHTSNAFVLNFSSSLDDLEDSSVGESFPPNSVSEGVFENDDDVFFFQEQESFTLSSDLSVDMSSSGTYNSATPGTISSGTVVDSYFFSFDPIGNLVSDPISIEFSKPILGIIYSNSSLDNTDAVLGQSGITYPTNVSGRAVEGSNGDALTWAGDNVNLSGELYAGNNYVDQFRVITEADVPFEFSPSIGLLMIFLTIIIQKTLKSTIL